MVRRRLQAYDAKKEISLQQDAETHMFPWMTDTMNNITPENFQNFKKYRQVCAEDKIFS